MDERVKNSINNHIKKFFGTLDDIEILEKNFPAYQIANVSILFNKFLNSKCSISKIIGTEKNYSYPDANSFIKEPFINNNNELIGKPAVKPQYFKPLSYVKINDRGVMNVIVFITYKKTDMVVYSRTENRISPEFKITILCKDIDKADCFILDFEKYEVKNSIFRFKIIRPKIDYNDKLEEANIVDIKQVEWDDIILPPKILNEIRTNVIDYTSNFKILKKNGFDLKRGILFHGVPGTGKSMVCNAIALELEKFTKIVVSGDSMEKTIAIFELARKYKPSLIIFEDIDLVCADRAVNTNRKILGELMNQWDGLGRNEEIICIFTTNYIDILEKALVERPGRIDVIIKFPLPDEKLIKHIIEVYSAGTNLDVKGFSEIVKKCVGKTPAFLKELTKRAAMTAIKKKDIDSTGKINLHKKYFLEAFNSLKNVDGKSAQKIIGF